MGLQQVLNRLLDVNYNVIVNYIVNRLKEYLEESGKEGFVVGLSGGIDSSVTTVLVSKATNNFFVLLMPSSSTPKEDMEDAYSVISMVKAKEKSKLIPIDDVVNDISKKVETQDKLVIGNVKARIRMTLLYAFAQKLNYLVVGTGDKSELLLGYFTKYGDGGVDLLPIGDLYKTQVRRLGAELGLPERIVKKPSSPALWEGQTAEGELGISYELADAILYLRFEEMKTSEEISQELGVDRSLVLKVERLVKTSQHKRLPPEIFRLSGRAINSDWRYPRGWS
ncbi:MAG: NAD synthetase [Candidatus Aramenus sulfurataquae]|jgi:NAD+ synthase|uniref:NH(3)-dependent NAD(+) synthetase n=2 Tax=Candidatus Aramenus sulfurataquae TaxID=1326980 RepID=W7KJK2_9CREN|nr:MAG: NAD synthetase [Candidatus Aramenus sulfurataquae]MCL7343746.1 NAD+ synthase [Candidatus Aramenus sulfurataquae]